MLLTAPFATFSFEVFRSLLFSGFFLLPAWTTFWVTLASMGIGMVLVVAPEHADEILAHGATMSGSAAHVIGRAVSGGGVRIT